LAVCRCGIALHFVVVATAHLLQDVVPLVPPATLMQGMGIDRLEGCRQPTTTVGDDQQSLLAFQPTAVEVLPQAFPSALALPSLAQQP
jgi:hypothetical protein